MFFTEISLTPAWRAESPCNHRRRNQLTGNVNLERSDVRALVGEYAALRRVIKKRAAEEAALLSWRAATAGGRMPRHSEFWDRVQKHPDRVYIIHYSSQSLFDAEGEAGAGALSPRITSIVVRHFESGQAVSFATHIVAEYLGIAWDAIEERYDEIERELLTQFYDFARDRREKFWVHWNLRNVTFGFEHLEHRYRVLAKKEPPSIPVEVRINLNDALKDRYGSDYAPDPRMPSLMELNGGRVQGFLSGNEESEAFKAKDFIRMNASTIAKVGFFSHVISAALKGKLKATAFSTSWTACWKAEKIV